MAVEEDDTYSTHPKKSRRLEAISKGYKNAGVVNKVEYVQKKGSKISVEEVFNIARSKQAANDYVGAMDDATRALTIDPNHEAALLERGNLHRLAGNRDLARADWVHVTTIKPDGHAAASARVNLERMDVVKD